MLIREASLQPGPVRSSRRKDLAADLGDLDPIDRIAAANALRNAQESARSRLQRTEPPAPPDAVAEDGAGDEGRGGKTGNGSVTGSSSGRASNAAAAVQAPLPVRRMASKLWGAGGVCVCSCSCGCACACLSVSVSVSLASRAVLSWNTACRNSAYLAVTLSSHPTNGYKR
jgi:hypothetical protein